MIFFMGWRLLQICREYFFRLFVISNLSILFEINDIQFDVKPIWSQCIYSFIFTYFSEWRFFYLFIFVCDAELFIYAKIVTVEAEMLFYKY